MYSICRHTYVCMYGTHTCISLFMCIDSLGTILSMSVVCTVGLIAIKHEHVRPCVCSHDKHLTIWLTKLTLTTNYVIGRTVGFDSRFLFNFNFNNRIWQLVA